MGTLCERQGRLQGLPGPHRDARRCHVARKRGCVDGGLAVCAVLPIQPRHVCVDHAADGVQQRVDAVLAGGLGQLLTQAGFG